MRKFLFFVMAAVLFCGCDKEEGGDNLPCPVTEVSVPASSEENPVSPGSSVTIQGQGFTANSEIWLRAITRAADVQARITKGDGKRVSPYYEYNVLASDNLNIVLPWNTVYKVIRQTNNLIQKIESGSIQSSDTKELNRIKSEALVMRGLSLFNLTRLFGMPYTNDKGASLGVPIETSPSDPTHKPSRSTVAQCYEQVVSDMSNALSGLKQETSNGYINYWAAQALLSRVYLNMGEYQKAYDAATDVIKNNGGRYQLYSYEEYPNDGGRISSRNHYSNFTSLYPNLQEVRAVKALRWFMQRSNGRLE